MKKYKVYSLTCPKTNETRYVGITYRPLKYRLREHITRTKASNSKKIEWIHELAKEGLKPVINLIKDDCPLDEAIKLEESLIKKYKGTLLNNHTRGSKNNFENQNGRKVFKCNLDGEIIESYSSVSEACAMNSVDCRSIQRCLALQRKTAGGFIWRYAEKRKLSYRTILLNTDKLVGQFSGENCIAIYKDTKMASEITKIDEKEIKKCCANKKKQAANFVWQYIDTI